MNILKLPKWITDEECQRLLAWVDSLEIQEVQELEKIYKGKKMKYRKKPVVIEAVQFKGNIFVHPALCRAPGNDEKPYIETLEGKLFVSDGDWIITGVKGEHYPCKPDIFEATYEKCES